MSRWKTALHAFAGPRRRWLAAAVALLFLAASQICYATPPGGHAAMAMATQDAHHGHAHHDKAQAACVMASCGCLALFAADLHFAPPANGFGPPVAAPALDPTAPPGELRPPIALPA